MLCRNKCGESSFAQITRRRCCGRRSLCLSPTDCNGIVSIVRSTQIQLAVEGRVAPRTWRLAVVGVMDLLRVVAHFRVLHVRLPRLLFLLHLTSDRLRICARSPRSCCTCHGKFPRLRHRLNGDLLYWLRRHRSTHESTHAVVRVRVMQRRIADREHAIVVLDNRRWGVHHLSSARAQANRVLVA